MTGPQADRDRRLTLAIPPIAEPDEETQWLDPTDADDRALLIAAAHPELDTGAEAAPVDGHEINLRLHLTIHEIVATQIVDDDPPEVWATAQRLRKLGYGRHEILHMIFPKGHGALTKRETEVLSLLAKDAPTPRSHSASTSAGERPSTTSRTSWRSLASATERRRPRTRCASRPANP
jgi:hypothetical protein